MVLDLVLVPGHPPHHWHLLIFCLNTIHWLDGLLEGMPVGNMSTIPQSRNVVRNIELFYLITIEQLFEFVEL